MSQNHPHIFDRDLLRYRRDKASENICDFDFLLKAVADNIFDRLSIVKKDLPSVLVMGDVIEALSKSMENRIGTNTVITSDISGAVSPDIVLDEENFPFAEKSFDAVISLLSLQWVNNLQASLLQIKDSLKLNSLFVGALVGGDSLKELRTSLMEAELKISGGVSPRVSPFVTAHDMSKLMQRTGFEIPVVDSEVITVKYASAFNLMQDLRGMGASNILNDRINNFSSRELFFEAAKIYQEKFSNEDGSINASFDIVYFVGWTADIK